MYSSTPNSHQLQSQRQIQRPTAVTNGGFFVDLQFFRKGRKKPWQKYPIPMAAIVRIGFHKIYYQRWVWCFPQFTVFSVPLLRQLTRKLKNTRKRLLEAACSCSHCTSHTLDGFVGGPWIIMYWEYWKHFKFVLLRVNISAKTVQSVSCTVAQEGSTNGNLTCGQVSVRHTKSGFTVATMFA